MRIERNNTNFGAIRVRPNVPAHLDKYSELNYAKLPKDKKDFANEVLNKELLSNKAINLMHEIANTFKVRLTMGTDEGRHCYQFMTAENSDIEKSALKKITSDFNNMGFDIETVPNNEAEASVKSFIKNQQNLNLPKK